MGLTFSPFVLHSGCVDNEQNGHLPILVPPRVELRLPSKSQSYVFHQRRRRKRCEVDFFSAGLEGFVLADGGWGQPYATKEADSFTFTSIWISSFLVFKLQFLIVLVFFY